MQRICIENAFFHTRVHETHAIQLHNSYIQEQLVTDSEKAAANEETIGKLLQSFFRLS